MAHREDVLLGAFVGVEGAHFFSAMLPSIFTIQKFAKDEESIRALRTGEMLASLFAVSLGFIVSELTESELPLLFAVGTVIVMLIVYESAIRGKLRQGVIAAAVAMPIIPP